MATPGTGSQTTGTSSASLHWSSGQPGRWSSTLVNAGKRESFGSNGHFFSGQPPSFVSEDASSWRLSLAKILYSQASELVIAFVLICNLVIIIIDTDLRAKQEPTPVLVLRFSDICLGVYLLEFGCRLYVERSHMLSSNWNILDACVVSSGVVDTVLELIGVQGSKTSVGFTMIRTVRLLRLFRAMKLMSALTELRKLIQMMMLCMRTLFWSCLLAFLLMTMWSVLMVELVHPAMQELESSQGVWNGDTDWSEGCSSVMRANLMLFQTIVAGDSWGKIPLPIIEAHPWTVGLFIPAHVTLVFGVLNLIVVVLVDTFAEQRDRDVKGRLADKQRHETEEKKGLQCIFDVIDADGSGTLTVDELQAAATENSEFSGRLQLMDVREDDLQMLFSILDEDGSGDVDSDEFTDIMYRLQHSDSQASIIMLKHFVQDLVKRHEQVQDTVHLVMNQVSRMSVASLQHQPSSVEREPSQEAHPRAPHGDSPREDDDCCSGGPVCKIREAPSTRSDEPSASTDFVLPIGAKARAKRTSVPQQASQHSQTSVDRMVLALRVAAERSPERGPPPPRQRQRRIIVTAPHTSQVTQSA